MKNLLIAAAMFLSINVFAKETNPNVNEKVLTTFNKIFKEAENIKWLRVANYMEASFTTGKIRVKAFIDSNGNLLQTIRYYKGESLPSQILYNLKNEYTRHEVWGVAEVSNGNGILYNITLKDNKNWYHVKMNADGQQELVKKYKRGEL